MFSDRAHYAKVGDPNGYARVGTHQVAHLEIVSSPDPRMNARVLPLEHERATVGRCGASHLNVAVRVAGDARISRANSVFEHTRHGWVVIDNNSPHGTWVGHRRLASGERHLLLEGDLVSIGGELDRFGRVAGGAIVRFIPPQSYSEARLRQAEAAPESRIPGSSVRPSAPPPSR